MMEKVDQILLILDNGSVRVYEWDGTTWKMRGLEINGENSGDMFGIECPKLSWRCSCNWCS